MIAKFLTFCCVVRHLSWRRRTRRTLPFRILSAWCNSIGSFNAKRTGRRRRTEQNGTERSGGKKGKRNGSEGKEGGRGEERGGGRVGKLEKNKIDPNRKRKGHQEDRLGGLAKIGELVGGPERRRSNRSMAGRTRLPSTRDGAIRGPSGGPGILGPFAAQQQHQQVRAAFAQLQQPQIQLQQQQPPPPDLQRNFVKGDYGNGPPPTAVLDQTIQAQQNEIRLLLTENQHLADAHVALRQELLAAQQEGQRMQALLAGVQSEKDGQVRALLENSAKLEADLRANEPLKVELQQARFESKRYTTLMHELQQQLRNVNTDLHRFRTEAQQIPALKVEMESLRQDVQRTRTAYEYEKSVNSQYLEQKQLAEKNLVAMAREVESLRAELTNMERRGRFPPGGYDGISPVTDSGYGRQQPLTSDDYAAAYAVQGSSQWSYDSQRRNGLQHGRR